MGKYSYILNQMRNHHKTDSLKIIYHAFVQSNFNYNIVFWGNLVSVGKLFKIQKRIVRRMLGLKYAESCRSHFRKLGILTIAGLYLFKLLKLVKENTEDYRNFASVHGHYTRGRHDIKLVGNTSAKYYSNVLGAGARLFNKLPNSLKTIENEKNFEKELKDYLVHGEFYSVEGIPQPWIASKNFFINEKINFQLQFSRNLN